MKVLDSRFCQLFACYCPENCTCHWKWLCRSGRVKVAVMRE